VSGILLPAGYHLRYVITSSLTSFVLYIDARQHLLAYPYTKQAGMQNSLHNLIEMM
jgi:hypothetical protein